MNTHKITTPITAKRSAVDLSGVFGLTLIFPCHNILFGTKELQVIF